MGTAKPAQHINVENIRAARTPIGVIRQEASYSAPRNRTAVKQVSTKWSIKKLTSARHCESGGKNPQHEVNGENLTTYSMAITGYRHC